jgi:hypothetical protein
MSCVRRARSIFASCDTFNTLARRRFASPRVRRTLTGVAASLRFEVMAATMVVRIALRLK